MRLNHETSRYIIKGFIESKEANKTLANVFEKQKACLDISRGNNEGFYKADIIIGKNSVASMDLSEKMFSHIPTASEKADMVKMFKNCKIEDAEYWVNYYSNILSREEVSELLAKI